MSSIRIIVLTIAFNALIAALAATAPGFDSTEEVKQGIRQLQVGPLDWPQWGGSSYRNNTPEGHRIPLDWNVQSGNNVLWSVPLGSRTRGTPAVANGRIFVGTNNAHGYASRFPPQIDVGALIAFDEKTGRFLWQASSNMSGNGRVTYSPGVGNCSTPYCEGDRLWYVTIRGEVVCLDADGFHDGENDGPYQFESSQATDEDDIVWRFDMVSELGVVQHKRSASSITCQGDYCYVVTGNGVGETHQAVPVDEAPSLICLNKSTGALIWSDNTPRGNILHGQWSSPCIFRAGDRDQVVIGGGDGWIYSFDPAGNGQGGSKLIWKFDGNPKESVYRLGGKSATGELASRNPVVSTPVFYSGFVYVGMGEDPEYGEGASHLYCIDPTRLGDVSIELAVDANDETIAPRRLQAVDRKAGERAIPNPNSAAVWHYSAQDRNQNNKIEIEETMHRTVGSVVIKDDILYAADLSGIVHCLDARRSMAGQPLVYWTHDMFAAVAGSPLLVENKVYIGDEDGDVVVFEHGQTRKILAENTLGAPIATTPIVANNTLYIASQNRLFALQSGVNFNGNDINPAREPTTRAAIGVEEQATNSPSVLEPLKTALVDDATANPQASAAAATPRDRIESSGLLLIETDEGLSAYSVSLGKWETIKVGRPKDGRTRLEHATVGASFAAVLVDNQLLGYSSKAGLWGRLQIPDEAVGSVAPVVGQSMVTVKVGDRTYALSPRTGAWTAPGVEAESAPELSNNESEVRDAEQKLKLALDSTEARRLMEEISKHESRAQRQADHVRQLLRAKPIGEPDTAAIRDAKKELEGTLAKAFELKGMIERLRIKELQNRLSRMEQQIGQRRAQATEIIRRRATELIEGEETEWNAKSPADVRGPASRVEGSFSTSGPQAGRSTVAITIEKPNPLDSTGTNQKAASTGGSSSGTVNKNSAGNIRRQTNQVKQPNEFFVMNEDGSGLRSLYLFDQHPHVGSPAVSPDGRWIAFDQMAVGNPENVQIYVMSIDGGTPQKVCSGLMPTWYDDNRNLLCTRREPRYGIWKVDTQSQKRTFVQAAYGGQISPDGSRIAINFNGELNVLEIASERSKTVIGGRSNPFVHIVSNGTWSSDGQQFCFVGVRPNGVRDIATTTMTGQNDIANLKIQHSYRSDTMTDFAWHPNGNRLLFSAECPERKGLRQLYEIDPRIPGSMRLVAGQDETRNNTDLCWTPDGGRLIFISGDYYDE